MNDEVKKEVEKIIEYYTWYYPIEKFKDKANWDVVSYLSNLSKDFIREFKNELNLKTLLKFKTIDKEFYNSLTLKKVRRYDILDI